MKFLSNYPTEVLILLFLSITYFISAYEKITDWTGNVSFIKAHFKNSPLKNKVPFLLSIVLIVESIAVLFMLIGIFQLYTSEVKEIASFGLELSAVTLLFLLIGQRLAKDYPGAMSLTVYFTLTVFGIYLLNN